MRIIWLEFILLIDLIVIRFFRKVQLSTTFPSQKILHRKIVHRSDEKIRSALIFNIEYPEKGTSWKTSKDLKASFSLPSLLD